MSNHKRKYFRDPTTPRIPQSFKYNGVNKEQWNLFVQKHTEELMKIGKGYLLNEEELRRRRTPPLRPPIIPVPHHETNAAANIRVTNQRRDDREYEKAKERYDRDQREMEADFDLALACAGDLCTDRIKTDKHKARAAARGDQLARIYKARGIKPPESFSPTVSAVTFALLLQVAVSKGLHMATTDITAAYLQVPYSKSDPVIITKLEENIAKICGLDPNQLFRINKYLYGLPNSGRAFYYHYRAALEKEGYRCSRIDPCLFIKAQNEEKVYIIIHVDDTFVFADNRDDLKTFTDQMNKHFPMTLDTAADSFLGMKINRTEEGDIELSQPKLVEKLLKECNELSRQPRKLTTHPYGPPRSHNAEDKDSKPCYGKQEANKETYLRILGMLMYLTRSRPDILTAVSYCATKSSSPEPDDMEHLYNIAKYISDTKDSKYIISRGIKEQKITIICEVDAGYLSHHDSKSHTGYAIKFSGSNGFFYIRSNKQKTVATSSTHAEMQAVHTLVKDILYILQLLEDMGEEVNLPVVIMEDNSAVIQTSTGEAAHLKRCKHFLMIINYVREQVERGYIELRKIKGEDNTSDILTKRVRTKDFRQKAKRLMGSHD